MVALKRDNLFKGSLFRLRSRNAVVALKREGLQEAYDETV